MKIILRSFRSTLRLDVGLLPINHQPYTQSPTPIKHSIKFINTHSSLPPTSYTFATSKLQQNSNQQPSSSSNPPTKDFKISQLKQLFQTKMNKYNLKALIKIYQTLLINNVPLSPSSLKQFDYRLILELNSLDHPAVNFVLEMCYRNGQYYQPKGNNKLLRALNVKFQKQKLLLVPEHVYRTLKLLTQMRFPKLTIQRVIFSLVKQLDPTQRAITFIDNLNALKITLMAVEMVQLDLEVKKRVLENFLKIKPKNVIELTYFYSILKTAVTRLDEAVVYEAQKKTVYDLAFNPYGMDGEQTQNNAEGQQKNKPNNNNKESNNNTLNNPQKSPSVNPTIMQRLIKQKEQILEQTLNKLNIREMSQQLYTQLTQTLVQNSQIELSWREMKQLCLLLIGNGFGGEGRERRELVGKMVGRILKEGLEKVDCNGNGNDKSSQQPVIDSSKLIRLPQFIILAQFLSQSSSQPLNTLKPCFHTYHFCYYRFMNLQQKLMFLYHQSKLLTQPINIPSIKQQLTNITYGLDPEEFGWLNKLLAVRHQRHSQEDKKVIKEIWAMVERGLDRELEILAKERVEKEMREAQEMKERKEKHQKNIKQKQNDKNNQTQSTPNNNERNSQ